MRQPGVGVYVKRLERLYALSERLRRASPGTVSTSELADEFEVSRRTIERDLDALRRAGASLWGQTGRSGGVGILDRGRRMVSLTDSQIAGLAIAAHAAGDAPFATEAKRGAETLVEAAGVEATAAIEHVRARVLLATEGSTATTAIRRQLEQGIVENRQVSLRYRDGNDHITNRRVDPVGFLGNGPTWSLIAHCHMRDDGRLFRLQRIERATMTKRPAREHDVHAILGDVPFETREPR